LAALEEYQKKRFMVVGDLAIKTVEQAIEALAALEGKHFHLHPRVHISTEYGGLKRSFRRYLRMWMSCGALMARLDMRESMAKGLRRQLMPWSVF